MKSNTSNHVPRWAVEPLTPVLKADNRSNYFHRQFIGGLGLALPFLLVLLAGLRPTDGLPSWKLLSSISAYYYTGSVAVFVGVHVILAVYLFTYQGYENKYHRRDRLAAIIA